MTTLVFYIGTFIALAIFLWLISLFYFHRARKLRDVSAGLGLGLFLVSLPETQPRGDEKDSLKNFTAQMENFLVGLATLRRKKLGERLWGNPVFTLEIASHNNGSEIFFYIAFPKIYATLLQNQLHGAFPDAKIELVLDYNIFNAEGATAGGVALSTESEILPIKTYQKLSTDPLETITSAFSKINEFGEGAAMQVVLRAGGENIKKRAHSAAKKIKEGVSKKEVLGKIGFYDIISDFF